jgi:hypothetical protein
MEGGIVMGAHTRAVVQQGAGGSLWQGTLVITITMRTKVSA